VSFCRTGATVNQGAISLGVGKLFCLETIYFLEFQIYFLV